MGLLLLFLMSLAEPAPPDNPKTYLASIEGIDLAADESIDEFAFETWGVQFEAVCQIPYGWRIEAGNSATPDGTLKGTGSHGITWINRSSLRSLRNLTLVTLYAPVQRDDIRDTGGHAIIPATFKGYANVNGRRGRKVKLGHANVRLTPAGRCPKQRQR